MVFQKLRFSLPLLFSALLSACTATGDARKAGPDGAAATAAAAAGDTYRSGFCPSVAFREGTTFFRTYERGGDGDPSRVTYQASLAEATRQCRLVDGQLVVNVVAAGRLAAGPKGGPGSLTMPIRVAVVEGDRVLYSQLKRQAATLEGGAATTQFLFSDPDIVLPADVDRRSQIYVGFDEGPYDTP